jgi:ferritin-like metal-binding protein YciE
MLRTAFENHLKETKRHLERLQQAVQSLGETPRARRCDGMRGLLTEGNAHVRGTPKGALRDAIMITSAQKVEHYEMAAYGTARTYAAVLGRSDIARLLDDTLEEEKSADQKLTAIAESSVNEKAAEEWHRQGAGMIEWVGETVGATAARMRSLAGSVGLTGPNRRQIADTMNRTLESASETVGDAAQSAVQQARKIARQTSSAARAMAQDRARTKKTARGRRSRKGQGKKR